MKKKEAPIINAPIPTVYTVRAPIPSGQYWTEDYKSTRAIEKEIELSTNKPYSIFKVHGRTIVHVVKDGKLACMSCYGDRYYTSKDEVNQLIDFINNG